ncbi:hypothetical protein [Demequina sp. NBRC 110054]|uniref:hypothetical protein n=1 Tax=Demequina sp. NBRC 110054 TaxID=1570343 RepID=UPI0011773E3C|nr:hypothetical protein [Demequina sp. NBRC 110054]
MVVDVRFGPGGNGPAMVTGECLKAMAEQAAALEVVFPWLGTDATFGSMLDTHRRGVPISAFPEASICITSWTDRGMLAERVLFPQRMSEEHRANDDSVDDWRFELDDEVLADLLGVEVDDDGVVRLEILAAVDEGFTSLAVQSGEIAELADCGIDLSVTLKPSMETYRRFLDGIRAAP